MTKIISIGDNKLDEESLEDKRIKFAVYDYHADTYEGWGTVIGRLTNGLWFTTSLSHCSCNDALDGLKDAIRKPSKSLEDVYNGEKDDFDESEKHVYEYIKENNLDGSNNYPLQP